MVYNTMHMIRVILVFKQAEKKGKQRRIEKGEKKKKKKQQHCLLGLTLKKGYRIEIDNTHIHTYWVTIFK